MLSRQHYAAAPTYVYRFDFDSKHFNFMRILTCGRKVRGTCHGDDLCYLFYNAGAKKLKYRTAEYRTIRRFVSILVKFAECGDPNIPLSDDTTLSVAIEQTANSFVNADDDDNNDAGSNNCKQHELEQEKQTVIEPEAKPVETFSTRWLPVGPKDVVYKCLNISDELEVIDLPEADKLKLWDAMYADTSLLY